MVRNERMKGISVSSLYLYFLSYFFLPPRRIVAPRVTYEMKFNAFLEFITWAARDSYFEPEKYIFQAWRYFCFFPLRSVPMVCTVWNFDESPVPPFPPSEPIRFRKLDIFFSKRHCVYLAQSTFQTERSNYRFEITTIRHHENNAPRFINGIRFSPVGKRGADAFIRPKGSRHGSPTTFTEPRFLLYNWRGNFARIEAEPSNSSIVKTRKRTKRRPRRRV